MIVYRSVMRMAGGGKLFDASAWNAEIGKTSRIMRRGRPIGVATLLAADVIDGGNAVVLSMKWELPALPAQRTAS